MRAFALILALALPVLPLASLPAPAAAQEQLRIAAVVNDDVITGLDLAVRTRMAILSAGLPDTPEARSRVRPQVLRAMVDERLKLQEAQRQNVSVSQGEIDQALARIAEQNRVDPADLERWLASGGLLLKPLVDQIRSTIAWDKLVIRRLGPTVQISDEEIEEVVRRAAESQGQSQRRVSEIFLAVDSPAEEEQVRQGAERLVEQIRAGADFSSVAVQFSDSATAAVGGDIGWVLPGQLSPEIEAELERLGPGELAAPMRTAGGYYILLLRDVRAAPSGEPDRGAIRQALQRERLDLLARRYLRDLRRAAFVDIRV